MGDAMSENQRDMEALALRQHFGKRNRCDKCGQGVLLHFVDGAGVVLCPKEEPCHSHTKWAAGFSMGPRKTRHRIKPKHRASGRWVKLGGDITLPGDAVKVRLVAIEGNKAKLRPITFDNGGCQVDNTADNST